MRDESAGRSGPAEVALHELLVRCRPRLLARIRWMMGTDARRDGDSEDFQGLVFATVLEQARQLRWESEEHFLNLVTRIARNTIVNRIRRPRVQRFDSLASSFAERGVPDVDGSSPTQAAEREDTLGKLLDALESLSDEDQRVIELRDFEAMSFREIAVRMGRTENAVQLLHSRALGRLGRALQG